MLYRVEDDIEIISVEQPKRKVNAKKTVTIKSRPFGNYKTMRRYRLQITGDLIEATALMEGDKVHLGHVKGANIWVLVPTEFPDGLTLKAISKNTFAVDNVDLVAKLHTAADADDFDAWADNGRIYFKPKEEA